jgi:two-component system NtrC family sensor kinase
MKINTLSPKSTILVVDDTQANLRVLFDLLNREGFRVSCATGGQTALERLESFLPDLILLDVMMPGIDGFEICRRIKANPDTQDIPIIFMTALSDSVDKVKGLTLGAVDYITKPIHHEEVLARIQLHLKLHHLNQTLEQRVAERTAALNQTLEQLKQAQITLVQSEKMSSLGQLVAGLAHEINNPVNFIHGNINYIDKYANNLLEMLHFYQQEYSNPTPAIQEKAEELDLDFIGEDLVKLMNSMKMGTQRIQGLVLSLRNFSRLDEAQCKYVDIHEGLESTLVILQYRLKAKHNLPTIQIVKDYQKLPKIECYPSQLNQVFMNILTNAIDALEDSDIASPTITIRTSVVDHQCISVSITDNGVGIPESIRSKLFNPFFTTKPVGKGTGLGLPISYQIIVEKHHGKIECSSSLGQGTEFVVKIPVQQAVFQSAAS